MKKVITIAAVLAIAVVGLLGLAPVAEAELGNPSQPIANLTVIGQTATNNIVALEFPRAATVGIQIDTVSGAANTSNLILNIDTKIGNGTNWVTGWSALTNVATGTTLKSTVNSVTIGARQWLRFSLTNEAAGTVTNTVNVYVIGKDGL